MRYEFEQASGQIDCACRSYSKTSVEVSLHAWVQNAFADSMLIGGITCTWNHCENQYKQEIPECAFIICIP